MCSWLEMQNEEHRESDVFRIVRLISAARKGGGWP